MNKYIKILGAFVAVTISITSLSSASDKADNLPVSTGTATQGKEDKQYRFTVDGIEYTKDNINEIVKNVDDTLDIITNTKGFEDCLYINDEYVQREGPAKGFYWKLQTPGNYKIKITTPNYNGSNGVDTITEFNLKVVDKNEETPVIDNVTQSKSVKESKNNVSFNVISNNKDTSYKYYVRKIKFLTPIVSGSYEEINPYTFIGEDKDGYFETYLDENELAIADGYIERYEVEIIAENDKSSFIYTKLVDKINDMKVTVNGSDCSNYMYYYNYDSGINNAILESKDENARIIIEGKYNKYMLYAGSKLLEESTDKNYFDINKDKYPQIYKSEVPITVASIDKDGNETRENLVFEVNCNENHLPQTPEAYSNFFNPQGSTNDAMVCVKNYEEGNLYKFELIKEYENINGSSTLLLPETVLVKDYSKDGYFEIDTKKCKTDYKLTDDCHFTDGQGHIINYYVKVTAKNDYGVSKEVRTSVIELDHTCFVDPIPAEGLWGIITNGIYTDVVSNKENKVSYNTSIYMDNTILPVCFSHPAKYYSVNGQEIKEISNNKINVSFDKAGENIVKIYEDDNGKALLDIAFNVMDNVEEENIDQKASQTPEASNTPQSTKAGDNNIAIFLIASLLLSGIYVKKNIATGKK